MSSLKAAKSEMHTHIVSTATGLSFDQLGGLHAEIVRDGPVDVTVTGFSDGAPAGCSVEEITTRFVAMTDSLNHGDSTVVDEFFGRRTGAPFHWYAMGVNNFDKFVASNWDDLASYFQRRRPQHERLRLLRIQFNGWDVERGLVHFGPVELTRHADDLPPGTGGPQGLVSGKGAYHCGTRAFIVLSLGMKGGA